MICDHCQFDVWRCLFVKNVAAVTLTCQFLWQWETFFCKIWKVQSFCTFYIVYINIFVCTCLCDFNLWIYGETSCVPLHVYIHIRVFIFFCYCSSVIFSEIIILNAFQILHWFPLSSYHHIDLLLKEYLVSNITVCIRHS